MTNLEKIKALIGYPIEDDDKFKSALEDRGLTYSDDFTATSSDQQKKMQLARADILVLLVTVPNISEGGFSLSLSDKQTLTRLANGIYAKYGEKSPLRPTAKMTSRW